MQKDEWMDCITARTQGAEGEAVPTQTRAAGEFLPNCNMLRKHMKYRALIFTVPLLIISGVHRVNRGTFNFSNFTHGLRYSFLCRLL